METQIVQQVEKRLDNEYMLAEKYYAILSAINNLQLTKREIELVAFTAVKGSISYANHRAEFCEKYNTTTATINNIVSKLKKSSVFIKGDGKIQVNPIIVVNFKKNLNLVIKLTHEEDKEVNINTDDSKEVV
tara:strand:- start:1257 stop:1652 length:396 start_codon:yes stop_codon:yes gene_type:complete